MRQIVLDTETTGLDPKDGHRIIEIGCVELLHRRLTGNTFHCYINPEREIDKGAQAVHGISNALLADKPVFKAIVQEFLDYINGAELIIHNAPFDVGFLNHEFKLCRQRLKKVTDYCGVFDTLSFARKQHPGQRNSLDALCKRYQIDNSHRELHGALLDAKILAQVYLAMTGGQASLFVEDVVAESPSQKEAAIKASSVNLSAPVTIIKATPDENEKHELYLKQLKEKNGVCVWLDDE